MSSHPLVVLHCPVGGGHKAAAVAIEEAARTVCRVVVMDALAYAPPWFRTAYLAAHQSSTGCLAPVYAQAFQASNHRGVHADEMRRVVDRHAARALVRVVQTLNPSAVIATHFYPLSVLADGKRRGVFCAPLVGVVTDHGAHAVWAEHRADAVCCANSNAKLDLLRHGLAPDKIVVSGIPVRRAFGKLSPWQAPAAGRPLRVLVTGGGFGVGPMLRILHSFVGIDAVELAVVCGNNPLMSRRAQRMVERLRLHAEVVGHESDMASRVEWAQVVVGKPGGLTTSECLAAGRPMVMVGALPGQERLNQRHLWSHASALPIGPAHVGARVNQLREAGDLGRMAAAAHSIGRPDAASVVVRAALHLAHRIAHQAA